jgi:2-C-methyl-D-erythritol 4-phosphate cytidylyltransferase
VGGVTRAASVRNGLAALRQKGAGAHDWVLVHDAARCLVTSSQIEALIAACEHDAVGGLLAHRLADTLKVSSADSRVAQTLSRADKWLAQTPQMFRIGMLLDALERTGDAVTDEASAIEAVGLRRCWCPAARRTSRSPFPKTSRWPRRCCWAARRTWHDEPFNIRVGEGWDVHQLVAGAS